MPPHLDNTYTMATASLTITIENTKPVALADFVSSFSGLTASYNRYVKGRNDVKLTDESKLYIQHIKEGSIVTTLTDIAIPVLAFGEGFNTVVDFTKYLKIAVEALLKNDKVENIPAATYENIACIVEPIAKDNASQMIFSASDHGTNNVNFFITSAQGEIIRNNALKECGESKLPETTNIYERQIMVFEQVRSNLNSQKGTKGIIDKLHTKPLNVIFQTDEIGEAMLKTDHLNPMTVAYVVDVEIDTVQGKPTVYRVLKFHESFDI